MKTRYLEIALAVGILLGAPGLASAATESTATTEEVTSFDQTATLGHDGLVTIKQQIDYDYAGAAPHDLKVTIPVNYHDDQGRDYRMKFSFLGATVDGTAVQLAPVVTPQTVTITLPPGRAAATTTTRHYAFRYTLGPTALNGDQGDVLRLVISNRDWQVPIAHATFEIRQPLVADNFVCYTGTAITNTNSCEITQTDRTVKIITDAPLPAGASLSLLTSYPRGSFSTYLQAYQSPSSWVGLGVTLAVLIGIIILVVVLVRRFTVRRPIARPPASEYTKANDSSENQAHRH